MTDQPSALIEAIVSIQAQLPRITKSRPANYGKYADLAQITDAVLPLLAQHGLAWTCCPTVLDNGQAVLEYALRHIGGETLGGRYPLPASGTPQAVGSSITYARRYSFCSILALVADEDDDGAAASKPARASRARATKVTPPKMISEPQLRKIMALMNQSGMVEREQRLHYCSEVAGRELTSSNDLTQQEAGLVIETLEQALAETHDEDPA